MTAGMPFSTWLIAAAKAHIVPLSSTSGTKVAGTCISLHPPADKVGSCLTAVFAAIILQQLDQGTVAMRHILELFEGIVLLCSGRDFPFPVGSIRIADVTGITISDSSRCHDQDALYSDMIAPIASFFFGSTMK